MRRTVVKVGAALAAAVVAVLGLTASSSTAATRVQATPASWTPSLSPTSTTQQVRQLVQCGNTMYAVGNFTSIRSGATTYSRNNAFSFSATNGAVTSWHPDVNGTVNSIALSADCSTAYLGGVFSTVHGGSAHDIAAVDTAVGALKTGFGHTANGQVSALLMWNNHLLTGGYFTTVNNSTRAYLTSLNPTTGQDDGYVTVRISGNYSYVDAAGRPAQPNATRVYNFSLSPRRTRLLVMGVFTTVSGTSSYGRKQIFMLDLTPTGTRLNAWYSPEFDAYCSVSEPFYVQDAAWSLGETRIYVATTGYKPATGLGYRPWDPRFGLCDAVASFPSTASSTQRHVWINYSGCDSLFSIAVDRSQTVYAAGHERWASNAHQCDNNNDHSAVEAPGMVGLDGATGKVVFNPTRGRGLGADDMAVTGGGLWIASDDYDGTDECAHQHGHAGICLLPY